MHPTSVVVPAAMSSPQTSAILNLGPDRLFLMAVGCLTIQLVSVVPLARCLWRAAMVMRVGLLIHIFSGFQTIAGVIQFVSTTPNGR